MAIVASPSGRVVQSISRLQPRSRERCALVELRSVARRADCLENAMEVVDRIKSTLAEHPIVLFMKGTPQFPMCGFSSRTAQALKAVSADYHAVNVLEDPEIRANLPRYSNWPTFPQLFIHGELIGGCDITMELYESGELDRLVKDTQKV
jgi:monothiol glutaredoxin